MSDNEPGPAPPTDADMARKADALLLRYRAEETRLERELDAVQIRLEITREVIASLSGQPRRSARGVRRTWPTPVPAEPSGDSTPPEAAA